MGAAFGQTVGGQLYRAGAVVFKPQHHKTVLCINCHADEPFFRVRLSGNALGGVIQRCTDDRAYLPCREEIQQLAVSYAGHIDAMLLAVQAFRGQQRVQNRVAGLVLGLILADAALHLGQGRVLFGLVALGTDGRNLHFQFVVAPVDKADVFLALFVLLILAAQDIVHGGQLAVQGVLPQLLMLDAQNQHACKVHQRADVENAHRCFAIGDKTQIADCKDRDRHDHRHQHGRRGDGQPGCCSTALFKPIQKSI